jgi:hypothetical protein
MAGLVCKLRESSSFPKTRLFVRSTRSGPKVDLVSLPRAPDLWESCGVTITAFVPSGCLSFRRSRKFGDVCILTLQALSVRFKHRVFEFVMAGCFGKKKKELVRL